jgi:hypothetical protein
MPPLEREPAPTLSARNDYRTSEDFPFPSRFDDAIPLVPVSGYTHPMATQRKQRNDRVQVPRDPALDRAIKRGRAAMGPSTPTSKVVRELALRGAEAFEGDEAAERKAVDFALSVADGTSGLDLERLRSARERAWGR